MFTILLFCVFERSSFEKTESLTMFHFDATLHHISYEVGLSMDFKTMLPFVACLCVLLISFSNAEQQKPSSFLSNYSSYKNICHKLGWEPKPKCRTEATKGNKYVYTDEKSRLKREFHPVERRFTWEQFQFLSRTACFHFFIFFSFCVII